VRWQVELAAYNVEYYIHIPGRENVLADGMSRKRLVEGSSRASGQEGLSEVLEIEKDPRVVEWTKWLQDKWYGEVVHYKLFGHQNYYRDENGEPLSTQPRCLIQHKSKQYSLLDCDLPNEMTITAI